MHTGREGIDGVIFGDYLPRYLANLLEKRNLKHSPLPLKTVSLCTKQNSMKCPFGPDEHLRLLIAVLQGLENLWDSSLSNIAGQVGN